MVCNKCNQNIEDDSKFCSFCGNKIENNTNEIEVDQKDTNLKDEVTQTKMGFYDFYLNHKGSIGRQEFFFRGFLPLSIINLILLIGIKISSSLIIYSNFYKFLTFGLWVISIFIFVIISNITVKRLHDMNSKSWFFIWNLVPFLNIILLLSLLSTPSSKIRNHGETDYYELTSSKILFSILNVCIIAILVVVFSLVNVLLKSHIEKEYLSSNIQILPQDEILVSFQDLKNTTPKKLDENTTLLSVNIDGMNVEFIYYMDNVNIDNMTKEVKNNFEKTVKTELCKEQLFIEVMNHNYNLNMKYLDKNYQIIGEVELSKNICK